MASVCRAYPGICTVCNEPFVGWREGQPYCSKSCYSIARRAWPNARPIILCPQCGQSFVQKKPGQRHCSWACLQKGNKPTVQEFWSKVDKSPHPKGCWIWQGYVGPANCNYGEFAGILAHRYAYQLYHPDDVLTSDDYICHSCDNPPCVRKEHLWRGTIEANTQDMVNKLRHSHGERHGCAKVTETIVCEIRRRWECGNVMQIALAKEFALSISQINNIVHYHQWKLVRAKESTYVESCLPSPALASTQ